MQDSGRPLTIMRDFIPKMIEVQQSYPKSKQLDFPRLLEEQFTKSGVRARITPGMRIAVGAGSRGISNLKEIVKATVDVLLAAGAKPFVIPAMGSHGGATPEGQTKVLAGYGITAESMGVPIEASMEVRKIGQALDGEDVFFSVPALEADAVIPVNRVKPHTDFRGNLGSGVQKMLAIGYGKQAGAANAHRVAAHVGLARVIPEFAKTILGSVKVLCGVAIVEDQHHQTAEVHVLKQEDIPAQEALLLEKARGLMARLPLDEIDLLIVDEIGKEISGTGMDTNVIGREIVGYSSVLRLDPARSPMIYRIFVRNLTRATKGNGIGLGMADFTTTRVVQALDKQYTYVNAITSTSVQGAKIPIYFDSDRETISVAISTLATLKPEKLRVVRIANTLSLERIQMSACCAELLAGRPGVSINGEAREMAFDAEGNLAPM